VATRCAIRNATVEDAARISALLTALAEQFIVGEFSLEGRLHLLASFAAPEMAKRLASGEYRFQVAEDRAALAGVVATRGGSHLCYLFVSTDHQRLGFHCVGPMQESNGVLYRPMEWRADIADG